MKTNLQLSPAPGAEINPDALAARFDAIRRQSLRLTATLSAEDQCVQSMPDTSPTKWHLAHTTWFFEAFVLTPHAPDYGVFDPHFNFLFNSYYEQVGPRHARPMRGLLTRPSLNDVLAYRAYVDAAVRDFFVSAPAPDILALIQLGLNHEQQHQELMLTDIKHVLSCNPLYPAYLRPHPREAQPAFDLTWVDFPGGLRQIGWNGQGFAFDCEGPRHKVWLEPYRLASRPVSNGEYKAFIDDGGYERAELWLSEGWAACQNNGWRAPLYWQMNDAGDWRIFTLAGLRPINDAAPVCHVSYFEADAYARWAGKRLPTEAEWECAAADQNIDGHFVGGGAFHPLPADRPGLTQMYGDVWQWTSTAYAAYPGFKPPPGAVGEYNGKFMSGQMVLRGASCVTPNDHVRASYRNFFYPPDRWQFSGIRLADDAGARAHDAPGPAAAPGSAKGFLDDVLSGLSKPQKTLPPKYFYDANGAVLFNAICNVPEYYPTRTEMSILRDYAADIARIIGENAMLIEYGAGSLDKVRILLDALVTPAALVAVDISEEQLLSSAEEVRQAFPDLNVLPVVADFTRAFALPDAPRPASAHVAFFPGSTIGNFEPGAAGEFLAGIAKTIGSGGGLLIGVDLKKDTQRLLAAYDDAEGVTAAFNKNVLERINRELGGDFDADLFRHVARYDADLGRIEMHLESQTTQTVTIGSHAFDFAAGETIHTENSYKYSIAEFERLAAQAGFKKRALWSDPMNDFAVLYFEALTAT